MCVAYIMRSQACSLDDALRRVRRARRCACPNASFLRQLMAFERASCDAHAAMALSTVEVEGGGTPGALVKLLLSSAESAKRTRGGLLRA